VINLCVKNTTREKYNKTSKDSVKKKIARRPKVEIRSIVSIRIVDEKERNKVQPK
jgi:hypothetical protein